MKPKDDYAYINDVDGWISELSYITIKDFSALDAASLGRRMQPLDRFTLLMNTYIHLSIGNVQCDRAPHFLSVSHRQVALYLTSIGVETSIATLFNYFSDRDFMVHLILEWASQNMNASKDEIKKAAQKIALQCWSAYGTQNEYGFSPKVSWPRSK